MLFYNFFGLRWWKVEKLQFKGLLITTNKFIVLFCEII